MEVIYCHGTICQGTYLEAPHIGPPRINVALPMDSSLVSSESPADSPPELQRLALLCANCGAELQRRNIAPPVASGTIRIFMASSHFAGEAVESISHADSRLWRTLWYLLSRPGFLTREFFAGRRSAICRRFACTWSSAWCSSWSSGCPTGRQCAGRRRAAGTDSETRAAAAELEKETGPASDALKAAAAAIGGRHNRRVTPCQGPPGPVTNQRRDRPSAKRQEILRSIQERNSGAGMYKGGIRLHQDHRRRRRRTSKSVVHNIPRAMFVFLPLLAMVMWLLYWRPRRHYVEHLLFLIHNHAFVFLVLAMTSLLGLIPVMGKHLGLLETQRGCT